MSGLLRLKTLWVVVPLAVLPGCVELGLVPPPADGGGNDNGDGGGIDNGDGSGDGDDGVEPDVAPIVRITASNTTPQPNEELLLRCEVVNQAGPEVTFEFRANELASTRLQTTPGTATARVVVQESDAGTAFNFTCTGTNSVGTGPASTPVLVIVTAPAEPAP